MTYLLWVHLASFRGVCPFFLRSLAVLAISSEDPVTGTNASRAET
jgi:hypothetical protein